VENVGEKVTVYRAPCAGANRRVGEVEGGSREEKGKGERGNTPGRKGNRGKGKSRISPLEIFIGGRGGTGEKGEKVII